MVTLCAELEQLCETTTPVIIVGDFNLPQVDWKRCLTGGEQSKEYIFTSFCLSNSLTQLVPFPTRPESSTILDLILTNDVDSVLNVNVSPGPVKSDHLAVYFDISIPKPQASSTVRLCYKRCKFEAVAANLAATNWFQFFASCESVNDMYLRFLDYLPSLVECFTPTITSSAANLDNFVKWATINLSSYRGHDHNRLARKLSKAASRQRALEERSLSPGNQKEYFAYIRRRLNMKSGVSPLLVNSTTVVADKDKASALKNYFESVYLSQPLPPFQSSRNPCKVLNDVTFSVNDIYLKLRMLEPKFSFTPDNIPPYIFKYLADVLATPLHLIFTRSFEDGEVPWLFKTSILTPVFKKGNRNLAENYRPIAQSVVPCLIMERLIVDAINQHLEDNDLLDPHQHGFTRGRSTATQLLDVLQSWVLAKNNGRPIHCIYFDFSKAFDRVNHRLLLSKMTSLGIGPRLTNWCNSYLNDRSFRVKVGESVSEEGQCPSGVPQGSCLGPLLYNIFARDIGTLFKSTEVNYQLYADDLKIYVEVKSENDKQALQSSINAVSQWATKNGMELSTSKCAFLSTGRDDAVYYLNGLPLPRVDTYKDLGILFDPRLKFRERCQSTAKAASQVCNLILRAFNSKDPGLYLKAYNSLVVPRWTYCSHIWSPSYNRDVKLLQKVQDRFLKKVIFRCGIQAEDIQLPSVSSLHFSVDFRVFINLIKHDNWRKYFKLRQNSLRSGISLQPIEVAKYNIVNHSFAWRICTRAHTGDPSLTTAVSVHIPFIQ